MVVLIFISREVRNLSGLYQFLSREVRNQLGLYKFLCLGRLALICGCIHCYVKCFHRIVHVVVKINCGLMTCMEMGRR